MMDANLNGTPVGSLIWVKFNSAANHYGDTTNIIAGMYKCEVLHHGKRGTEDNTIIKVLNPQFRKEPTKPSLIVHEHETGHRWVTYEGHVDESI